MPKIVRLVCIVAVVWVVSLLALEELRFRLPVGMTDSLDANKFDSLVILQNTLVEGGEAAGRLLSPVIQFGLIVWIIVYAIKEFFLKDGEKSEVNLGTGAGGGLNNVQALIAIIVVGAFALSALTGIGSHTSDLKDIALVVVGFYFGTRRRQSDAEADIAATGAAAGAAAADALKGRSESGTAGEPSPVPPGN
ncbi:MAG: hypothetical protein WDN49_02420 [Acetobacteraceae bacterium]